MSDKKFIKIVTSSNDLVGSQDGAVTKKLNDGYKIVASGQLKFGKEMIYWTHMIKEEPTIEFSSEECHRLMAMISWLGDLDSSYLAQSLHEDDRKIVDKIQRQAWVLREEGQ